MRNQKGFSGLEAFLVLVIIAFMAYVGWYVYNVRADANKTYNQVDKTASSPASKAADPTTKWNSYSSEQGKFFVKYPTEWSKASEGCTGGLLLLGGNSKSVGVCGSENFGQMSVISIEGDQKASNELNSKDGYKDIKVSRVTVSGVVGEKMSATVSGQGDVMLVGALPDGANVARYLFIANGRTYIVNYIKLQDYPDVLSNFDLMVTKTLKFQP